MNKKLSTAIKSLIISGEILEYQYKYEHKIYGKVIVKVTSTDLRLFSETGTHMETVLRDSLFSGDHWLMHNLPASFVPFSFSITFAS